MKYQAVLFDFDYTLGDATDSILAGTHYALDIMGYPLPTRDQVRATVGYVLADCYTLLTGDSDPERRDRFCKLFREKAHPIQICSTPLFPGAMELLESLHAAGIPVAVVSSKAGHTLRGILQHNKVEPLLSLILGSDDVHSPKPDPEGILITLERLGLSPDQILYCGDTVIDAEAAQRAGTDFCAVLNGTTPREAFEVWPHAHIAPDLTDLKTWLNL